MSPRPWVPLVASAIDDYCRGDSPSDDPRAELHVSDMVGARGWACARYVQLARKGTPRQASARDFHSKAKSYGTAMHRWIQDLLIPALTADALRSGYEFDLEVETAFRDSATGIVATPDFRIWGVRDGEPFHLVGDIKTMTPRKWVSSSKEDNNGLGFRPDAVHLRQLMLYADLFDTTTACFFYVVIDDLPTERKPDNHQFYQQEHESTGQMLLEVKRRLAQLDDLEARGLDAVKTESRSHCTDCPFRGICERG